jgi:urease accessory protein UreE
MLQMDTVLESTADDVRVDLPDVMVIDLTPLLLRSARDSVITCVELGRELANQHWTSVVVGLRVFVPVTTARTVMESMMAASAFGEVSYDIMPGSQVESMLTPNDAQRLFRPTVG